MISNKLRLPAEAVKTKFIGAAGRCRIRPRTLPTFTLQDTHTFEVLDTESAAHRSIDGQRDNKISQVLTRKTTQVSIPPTLGIRNWPPFYLAQQVNHSFLDDRIITKNSTCKFPNSMLSDLTSLTASYQAPTLSSHDLFADRALWREWEYNHHELWCI